MNRLNLLFTLSSLSVILVTVERFSFTTKILLPPADFIRLHQLVQMIVIILITTLIPFFIFKELSDNFKSLLNKKGFALILLFITGIYFYATGNGVHEVASFFWNQYCRSQNIQNLICNGLFINDYYLGNILYFIGAFLMNLTLLKTEKLYPYNKFAKKDFPISVINAVIYAFAIFAYAGFDVVLVGMYFSLISVLTILYFFFTNKHSYLEKPVTTNLLITYVLGTIASIIVRLI